MRICCTAIIAIAATASMEHVAVAGTLTLSPEGTSSYGNGGSFPSIAQNGESPGVAAEYHQFGTCDVLNCTEPFYYEQGNWTQGLGPSHPNDSGYTPMVAADTTTDSTNADLVSEIHLAGFGSVRMWASLGTMVPGNQTITWNSATELSQYGEAPSIAEATDAVTLVPYFAEMNDGVDSLGNPTDLLSYSTGHTSGTAVVFNAQQSVNGGEGGFAPTVAMIWDPNFNNNDYFTVNTHQAAEEGQVGALWSDSGTYTPGSSTISWSNAQRYDNGVYPSVAICKGNGIGGSTSPAAVVEVHSSSSTNGNVWYKLGIIATDHTISWQSGAELYAGGNVNGPPRVSCSGYNGMVVYEINDNGSGVGTLEVEKFQLNYQ